jgi:hypothetical protein
MVNGLIISFKVLVFYIIIILKIYVKDLTIWILMVLIFIGVNIKGNLKMIKKMDLVLFI